MISFFLLLLFLFYYQYPISISFVSSIKLLLTIIYWVCRCLELEVTKAEPPSASDSTSVAGFDEFLSTLRNNKDVRSFELSGCKLGDENIGKVVETLVLRERDLYSLELPGNEITDEGIQHVVAFLQKSNALRSLNLGRNRISDAGVSILVNALPSQLHELELYANSIGNAGLLSILNAAAPVS